MSKHLRILAGAEELEIPWSPIMARRRVTHNGENRDFQRAVHHIIDTHREAALAPVVDEACGPLRGLGRQQEVSLVAVNELPRRLKDPLAT